jgi:Zn-finger nucleic acid-binding protein
MREVERHEEELEAYHRKEGKPYKKKKGFLELFDLFD